MAYSDRNQLATDHLELVGHIVAEVSVRYPRHVDRNELWNAGALGLVEASRRFNEDAGIPFARYAAIRIRGAIIDSTRTRDWATRSVRRNLREIQQATSDFEEHTGRRPSDDDLATTLGITTMELSAQKAQEGHSTLLHLDQEDSDESPLRDQVAEQRSQALPEQALEQRELFGTLKTAIELLPSTQAEVVTRYYLQGESLQDIADDLKVTEARVSQIRAEALAAIRAYFSTLYEGLPEVAAATPGRRARASYLSVMSENTTWRTRLDGGRRPDNTLAV
ncbi:MAG: sigma-70 family RNA polymerase sigma factor [Acidimicrobiia bacterium]|nr:sigma-70 family RNA polymerase sigma factor [Acidimicrobiia bacterium]